MLSVTPTNAEVRKVDEPMANRIFVALSRLCLCYPEQENTTWMGRQPRRRKVNVSWEPKLNRLSLTHPPHLLFVPLDLLPVPWLIRMPLELEYCDSCVVLFCKVEDDLLA